MTDAGVTGLILQRSGPPKTIAATGTVVIEDPRLEDVIAPDAPLLCLYEHATFSEGTVWDAPRQRLVWSDVVGRRVLAWYPDGRVETVVDATAFINGNAVDRDGHLVQLRTRPALHQPLDSRARSRAVPDPFRGQALQCPERHHLGTGRLPVVLRSDLRPEHAQAGLAPQTGSRPPQHLSS